MTIVTKEQLKGIKDEAAEYVLTLNCMGDHATRAYKGYIEAATLYQQKLNEQQLLLDDCRVALAELINSADRCYDATEWPADGTTLR